MAVPRSGIPGTPLGPPPSDQLIQLVSFNKDAPPPVFGERAPWWTPAGIPRVDHITQFDGGPLQGVNSVMAAGAMLARLAYGIVTTGRQLRSLAPERRAGNSLEDLERALEAGANVRFQLGIISVDDLRAILVAGGGAVIVINYGTIPPELSNQSEFSGAHALYIDAYRPPARGGPDAGYFVLDPLGGPWHGNHGDWWPADIVDRAAMDFGGGGYVAAWAFAGGIVPNGNYPPLPASSFPPDLTGVPSSLGTVIGVVGPEAPPYAASYTGHAASQGGLELRLDLAVCLASPPPAFCPPGVPAEYPKPESAPPTVPPLVGEVPLDLLYTDVPQPGIWRTIVGGPSDVEPTFSYWPANGSGPAHTAFAQAVTLGGRQVWMVSVPIPQAGRFAFLASTVQSGVVTATDVGAISFGN